jgi:hypothetical protein
MIARSLGVANGCEGELLNVKYENNEYGEWRAICAYIRVPGANIQALGLPADVIQILPERNTFAYKQPGGGTYYISRSQLPLVPAYAYTANKIQGQSLKYALVNLKSARRTQALYVMILRAIFLENLAIMRWFPSTNLDRRLSPEYRNEFKRLEKLDERTMAEYKKRKWRPTTSHQPQKKGPVASTATTQT